MNRVKKYREAAKLSQRQLGEKIGTTQQTIQRIEGGVTGVDLLRARMLADALGVDVKQLFPELNKLRAPGGLAQGRNSVETLKDAVGVSDRDDDDALCHPAPEEDTDDSLFSVEFRFDCGLTRAWAVSQGYRDYLVEVFNNDRHKPGFICFRSLDREVFLQRDDVRWFRTAYDEDVAETDIERDDQERERMQDSWSILVFFRGDHTPTYVEPKDADDVDLLTASEDEIAEAMEDGSADMQTLSANLDGWDPDLFSNFMIIDDPEENRFMFDPSKVTILELPLVLMKPALRQAQVEGEEEDEDAGVSEEAKRAPVEITAEAGERINRIAEDILRPKK